MVVRLLGILLGLCVLLASTFAPGHKWSMLPVNVVFSCFAGLSQQLAWVFRPRLELQFGPSSMVWTGVLELGWV